jgi:PEP-CTERM motif
MSPTFRFASQVLFASVLSITSAHAWESTGVACDGHGSQMSYQTGYLDCSGSFSGNNLNQDVGSAILADFGLTVTASPVEISRGKDRSNGTLSFAEQSGPFVISLKAGNAFSLYEFAGGLSSIKFDTLGVGFFSGPDDKNIHFGQGLSHSSLYAAIPAVPEPSTFAMLLAGVGVLVLLAHRNRSKS